MREREDREARMGGREEEERAPEEGQSRARGGLLMPGLTRHLKTKRARTFWSPYKA